MPNKQQSFSKEADVFLDTAIEIGNILINIARTDGALVYWTVVDDATKKVSHESNDLYFGCSGIGLFFLELYKHTWRTVYLSMARRALRTAYAREKGQPIHSSFLCGRMGVAYALAKLYEVTGRSLYRSQALTLTKSCVNAYSTRQEYLTGNAGTILSLLHMTSLSDDSWLLEAINNYVECLLQNIQESASGIYWDREPFDIRPLCGFSHGVAGIGFTLLEIGRFFNNPAFYTLADQAFTYENAYFDTTHNNWPDFRLSMWRPEQIAAMEAAYSRGETEMFYEQRYMSAWCHGAPGIGLSRISAYQLTGKQIYLSDISRATQAITDANSSKLPLCHGLAGNLDVFIESYLALGRAGDYKRAQSSGKQLVQEWTAIRNNKTALERLGPSLFTGIAGIGYNLLRLRDPYLTPSMLAPHVLKPLSRNPNNNLWALRITDADARTFIEKNDTDSIEVRLLKRQMATSYPSNGLLYVKYRLAQKSARELLQPGGQLLNRTLQFDPDCVIHMPSMQGGTLLRYTTKGIEKRDIGLFCYIVLSKFAKPQKVRDVIKTICEQYANEPKAKEILRKKVLEQIRQAVRSLILITRITNESRSTTERGNR